ncbi:diguanylate cyclase domain-containing protein [Alteromonas sp. D210916BOD_24]|uniref:diguanylate cyclase domain-containing protein n=1 Tax=Alteromonas sp. D210916BOD_24 TaxID=3157618 RepID=UPI00399D388A
MKPYSECDVLIVDDEPMSRMVLTTILEPVFRSRKVKSGKEAIGACLKTKPDLVLLDMNMPDINGLDVCEALKANSETEDIPVIFITSTLDIESENACWEVGASDFVIKPVNASTLIHRIKTHLQNKLRTEFLENMTFHDQLTGLYNRMYLSKEIPLMVSQIARDKGSVGVIMIDIDFFKLYNDTYGHLDGDICLQQVANIISGCVKRPKDAVIRFGGEEILVVLPYIDKKGAKTMANMLVNKVREAAIPHSKGIGGFVSISAGYAVSKAKTVVNIDPEELLEAADVELFEAKEVMKGDVASLIEEADVALFQAKEMGRNRAKG